MKRAAHVRRAPAFSDFAASLLTEAGIPLDLPPALGLEEVDDGAAFAIPYGRRGTTPILRRWEVDLEPEPWPESQKPGVWWPAGRDGSTVIVCLGASDALFVTSQLFAVGFDGTLFRRPGLSDALKDAVVVALPCTFPGLAFEWYLDPVCSVRELLEELVVEDRDSVVLAMPRALSLDAQPTTADGEPGLDCFVAEFLQTGEQYGIRPGLALLPWGESWNSLLSCHRGAAKRAALGGILDYWHAMSRCAPVSDGDSA